MGDLLKPMIDEMRASDDRRDHFQATLFEVLGKTSESTEKLLESVGKIQEELQPLKKSHAQINKERWLVAKIGAAAGVVCAFLAFVMPWAMPTFWSDYRPATMAEARALATDTAEKTVREYDTKISEKITAVASALDAKAYPPPQPRKQP